MENFTFSVITVTKRINFINNVIDNFLRQNINYKELIVVVNNDSIKISDYDKYISSYNNIFVYKLPETTTLGKCLNFACDKSKNHIIAKFDDDDYYSPFYLNEVDHIFSSLDCHVVGKKKNFMYIEKYNSLFLKNIGIENNFANAVLGSTLSFKRDLIKYIQFRDLNCYEDKYFNLDCSKFGYKIYSSSAYNHIVFKHKNIDDHTFKSNISFLIKFSEKIKSDIDFIDSFDLVNKEFN